MIFIRCIEQFRTSLVKPVMCQVNMWKAEYTSFSLAQVWIWKENSTKRVYTGPSEILFQHPWFRTEPVWIIHFTRPIGVTTSEGLSDPPRYQPTWPRKRILRLGQRSSAQGANSTADWPWKSWSATLPGLCITFAGAHPGGSVLL